MSTYFVGDIHGCYDELMKLLEQVSFDKKLDHLWLTGDLVNRGLKSIEVMRFVSSLGSNAHVVLGNHDLNLIFIYASIKRKKCESDVILNILKSKYIDYLIDWLRQQPLLQIDENKKVIMVHAGIHPFWSIKTAKMYANKLESILCNRNYDIFFKTIFNSSITKYVDDSSRNLDSLSFSLNVFTKMRYCYCNGTLDMKHKNTPSIDTFPMLPWFSMKNSSLQDYFIFFGHWASLKRNITPLKIISLDTGCCWGGMLSMFRFEDKKWFHQKSENVC
ncbi:symmetrical bis(5'-nucleosyl)-tetraphosphatase [Buchnera aphidicola]|uniref:bis(5'-nucleosyl)-tetraphosphatase (symmetrical) n=1 Tax=Buchnera aphidicola subsp. Melaphis rhois TaxID=118103 RepID=A0A4D6Y2Q2_BUCMH|nr:symmetrical bis(5'-nucleosyl)-tetraphosphatase [Buchnera aphidicola]QCI23169.1 symmetrical bis(5'-nucleosyl)-tetraphosphatase [Buchnera aphidicola (Melaphis rhois)]